jgi:hypothetical protein
MKKILAVILALGAAWVVLKVFWWVVRHAFSLALDLVGIMLLVVIAVPIYFIIRKKLLS